MKFLKISLVFVLSFLLLVGCGSNDTNNNEVAKEYEQSKQEEILKEFDELKSKNNKDDINNDTRKIVSLVKENISHMSTKNADKMILDLEKILLTNLAYSETNTLYIKASNIEEDVFKEGENYSYDYNKLMANRNEISNSDVKDYLNFVKDGGYIIYTPEGMINYLVDYEAINEYSTSVSKDMANYLKFKAMDSANPAHIDAGLAISYEELSNRIALGEDFLKDYDKNNKIQRKIAIEEYLYFSSYIHGEANTPPFDFNTGKIQPDLLASYKNDIQSNSFYGTLIKELLEVLEANDYKYVDPDVNYEFYDKVLNKQREVVEKFGEKFAINNDDINNYYAELYGQ
ncbi:hypothetical protein WG909_09285 [Peptostreptococcaceae bacterium AGR-M142]